MAACRFTSWLIPRQSESSSEQSVPQHTHIHTHTHTHTHTPSVAPQRAMSTNFKVTAVRHGILGEKLQCFTISAGPYILVLYYLLHHVSARQFSHRRRMSSSTPCSPTPSACHLVRTTLCMLGHTFPPGERPGCTPNVARAVHPSVTLPVLATRAVSPVTLSHYQ